MSRTSSRKSTSKFAASNRGHESEPEELPSRGKKTKSKVGHVETVTSKPAHQEEGASASAVDKQDLSALENKVDKMQESVRQAINFFVGGAATQSELTRKEINSGRGASGGTKPKQSSRKGRDSRSSSAESSVGLVDMVVIALRRPAWGQRVSLQQIAPNLGAAAGSDVVVTVTDIVRPRITASMTMVCI